MKSYRVIYSCLLIAITLFSCNQEKDSVSGKRNYNDYYYGSNLNKIAFPIGGIGAGMFCLEGTGAISHMSVRNRPDVFNEPCMFAAISLKGVVNGSKVLEGQVPDWKKFGGPGTGNGSYGTSWGLPRFENARFLARFPFAYVDLDDKDIPMKVQVKGWSPFIPNDADNSSLPVGAIEYIFENTSGKKLEAVFSYNTKNFMIRSPMSQPGGSPAPQPAPNAVRPIEGGFILSQAGSEDAPYTQGDFAIFTNDPGTVVDHCWFRGGWFDGLTMVWNTIAAGETRENAPVEADSPGASLYVPFILKAGEKKTIRVMMTWYVPNTILRTGQDPVPVPSAPCCDQNYKPWYTSKFKDVMGVAKFFSASYDDLHKKSETFRDSFYNTTLPPEVIEAVAANLTIIKSPTCLRQEDGRLWSWEGCGDASGCCEGSCTHVWNYAQAIPHLFPQLERTLRETEFLVSQDGKGHQAFRSALPIRPLIHSFHAAADGQLGGIIKMYRDWRISGDTEWLKGIFPFVKQSMDFCIKVWDPREVGMLEEPHHNTYDIEFWGPDGMCTSFYLGALTAIQKMGQAVGEDVSKYADLYNKGKAAMETQLWDGEYFIQKIRWEDLTTPNPLDAVEFTLGSTYSLEAAELLKKEGPKYQYGTGCLSDGVLGSWMAEVSGLDPVIDAEKLKSHLVAIHKYNYKSDLRDHSNPQRPTYAWGRDGGLLLCSWPKGGALSLPFVYSNEVWTGIEYSAASHMMLQGEVERGLEIVRACRDRYDGSIRNPFNEYECGHWYARAMASYAMLQGLTGVRYDAIDQTLYIDSRIGDFTSFLSTNFGYGNVGLKGGKPFYNAVSGELPIKKCVVSGKEVDL